MKAIPAFTNTCLVCALSIEAATFRAPIHAVGRNATASKARRLQLSNYEVEDLDNNSSRVPPQEGSQGRRLRGPGRNQKPLNSDKGDAAKSDGNYWSCWSDDWTSSLGYDTDAGLELWASPHSSKDWTIMANRISRIGTNSPTSPPSPSAPRPNPSTCSSPSHPPTSSYHPHHVAGLATITKNITPPHQARINSMATI
jgi:hypothetical protein